MELGDGGQHILIGGVAELDDGVLELGAGLLLHGLGLAELIGAEDLPFKKDFREVAAGFGHRWIVISG